MQRNKELDSLRGLAATSVLLYHTLATNSATLTGGISLESSSSILGNMLIYTPLHIVWLGGEAVWFFFILSGFVLTRSANRSTFSWESYFPSRIVRLYLPVLFAVALAWSLYAAARILFDPVIDLGYDPQWILRDITLIGGTSTAMGVLWSLQWEVIFSLALPLYLLLLRKYMVVACIAAVALCAAGFYLNVPAASFLPMFYFGGLLAYKWEWVAERFRFLSARSLGSNVAGTLLLVAATCGMSSYYLAGRWLTTLGVHVLTATMPIILLSICVLVILGMQWPPLRSTLQLRPLVFLGTISFSLYLVHLPIVVILASVLPKGPLTAAMSLVISLVLGALFYAFVEKPSHRLARRIAARQRMAVDTLPRT